jgi:alkylated DNA repair protein (DNA oxidative demethylase)
MPDLFTAAGLAEERRDEAIAPGAILLRGFALPLVDDILAALGDITALTSPRMVVRVEC